MSMLALLKEVEREMPKFLQQRDQWKAVKYIKYKPVIKRLTMIFWKECTVHLNMIMPSKKSEVGLHSHIAPSAMRILQGGYEMNIAYGKMTEAFSDHKVITTIFLTAGSTYSMDDPLMLHSTRPLSKPSFSIMVNGKSHIPPVIIPYDHKQPEDVEPLTKDEINEMFSVYKEYYR